MKVSMLSLFNARNIVFANQLMIQLTGTKLGYSCQRNDAKIKHAIMDLYDLNEEEQVKIEEATVNNAATDQNGVLLFTLTKGAQGQEQKVYQYTKEGENNKNATIRSLQKEYNNNREKLIYDKDGNEAEVEVKLHLAEEYPKGFPPQFVAAFKGIYLKEEATEHVEISLFNENGQPKTTLQPVK